MSNRYIYNIGTRVIMVLLALCCWQGCTSSEATIDRDDPQPPVVNNGRVAVDLALNVSATKGYTRMASSDVNPTSLDIDGLSVLPFIVPSDQDSIRMTDAPVMDEVTGFASSGNHYLVNDKQLNIVVNDKQLNIGVNAFLCYAKAKHTNDYSATNHGSLNTTGSGLSSKFTLKPITKPTASDAILDYMNSIANAGNWKNHQDATVATEFNKFINLKNGEPQGLAGSIKNIIAYVNEWYTKAANIAGISGEIQAAIHNTENEKVTVTGGKVTAIKDQTTGNTIGDYPGTFPDGSAVIKWNGSAFVYESFPDYAYPAERYFYANSRIVTSNASQSTHYENDWSTVVSQYTDGDVVASTTRSVAIKNPLRYGVAGMEIHVKASTGTIGDNENTPISLGETNFPLTAVIVGSQVKQNCFFEPDEPVNQEEDEYLIYDKQIKDEGVYLKATEGENDNGPGVYTLGLQTKDDVSLKVVLEFENNRTESFTSENGVIHPGTKFYMLASVVPPGEHGLIPNTTTEYGDVGKRVMTRGHMTVVNLTIKSLKSAYNALPDLSSDKLRLFDVVTAGIRSWKPGQTGEHEVYNW